MSHTVPAELDRTEIQNPRVSYSALNSSKSSAFSGNSTAFDTAYYHSPPSAYEFESINDDHPGDLSAHSDRKRRAWTRQSGYSEVGSTVVGEHSGKPQGIRQWLAFWGWEIIALLWIVPAVLLLVLNLSNHVVGASAWCPTGHCPGTSSDPSVSNNDMKAAYDADNHNLIGALQFVAKALEVWFVGVAIGLLYQVTSLVARSSHGLPIGFLLSFAEAIDLLNIFRSVAWLSALPAKNLPNRKSGRTRRRSFIYMAFAVFAAFMCIVSNLIGPSMAVLLIPTLQWIEEPSQHDMRFDQLLGAQPPIGNSAISGCNSTDLLAGDYSCTSLAYAYSLDALVEYFITQVSQFSFTSGNFTSLLPGTTTEQALALKFNVTMADSPTSNDVYWAPSRQTVRELSTDFEAFYNASNNPSSTYAAYNNSLSLRLQREGPVIGMTLGGGGTNLTTTIVDNQRQIRCFHDWFVALGGIHYAKCWRAGRGWNSSSGISKFSVGALDKAQHNASLPVVNITSYFSDKAIYVPTTFTVKDTPPCLVNGTLPAGTQCDYDAMFNAPPPVGLPHNVTSQMSNALIIENGLQNDSSTVVMSEAYYSYGISTYAADASYSQSYGVVEIDNYPSNATMRPVAVDSTWLLAAWSIKNGENVAWTRPAARQLHTTSVNLCNSLRQTGHMSTDDINYVFWILENININLQAASLINFNFTDPAYDGLKLASNDANRPSLGNNVRRQVWMYGTDSRTSKLGIAVTSLAIVLVLIRVGITVVTRIRLRSAPELLIAAMKHHPRGEFEGVGHKETDLGRVRFSIKDDLDDNIHFSKKTD